MAGSRLEKIGTIFSRTSGLLRTGVMKVDDKPIWYDVYAMHPPAEEPRFDRPAPNIELRDIFYEEDLIRAKFHKKVPGNQLGTVKLNDRKYQTTCQKFIEQYKKYQAQGALDDEKIFEVAFETVQTDVKAPPPAVSKPKITEDFFEPPAAEKEVDLDLVSSFKAAQEKPAKVDLGDLLKDEDSKK